MQLSLNERSFEHGYVKLYLCSRIMYFRLVWMVRVKPPLYVWRVMLLVSCTSSTNVIPSFVISFLILSGEDTIISEININVHQIRQSNYETTETKCVIMFVIFISGAEIHQLNLTRVYNISDFRTDVKAAFYKSGVRDINTVFLLADSDIVKVRTCCVLV